MTDSARNRSAHEPAVVVKAGRYPYLPSCSCGWVYGRGYVAGHAALDIAEAHADGTLNDRRPPA
jgi:hypothetical protein